MPASTLGPILTVQPTGTVTIYQQLDRAGAVCDGTGTSIPVGSAQNTAGSSGGAVPAMIPSAGLVPAVANGAIKKGQRCYTAASGKVAKTSTGVFVGRANVAATADLDQIVLEPPTVRSKVLAMILAASAVITNLGTETAFSNGSYTIPADELQPGDILEITARGVIVSENSTNTHRVRLYLGSTALLDTTARVFATADSFVLKFRLRVLTDGASGTMIGDGLVDNIISGAEVVNGQILASTALDTTVTNALAIKSLASATSASNQIRLDSFEVVRVNDG